MSQFTRSILYSTAVIALGLAAVIAIYSDMQGPADGVAMVEPAAGEEAPVLEQTTFESTLPAGEMMDSASEMMSDAATTSEEKAEEILAEIETIIQEAEDSAAADMVQDIAPAAGDEEHGEMIDDAHDAVEDAAEKTGDAIEEAADAIHETGEDAVDAAHDAADDLHEHMQH